MYEPFLKPLKIIEKLEENGFEAYFVGGSVRDVLIGRQIGDIDIATSAKPEMIVKIFQRTINVGAEHGTVVVLFDGTPYEVTTFRQDSEYVDYRHPKEVKFISSLKEDLKRRDFTMNAIAMTKTGEIIDPFGGQKDIEAKFIRTVGNPDERFHEDALRMMRAVRFVSQLSFTLSPSALKAITRNRQLLENISIERITVEFMKLVKGRGAHHAFKLLHQTKLYHYLPGFKEKEEQLATFSLFEWSFLKTDSEYWLLMLFLMNETKDVGAFLKKWKLPNKIIKDVAESIPFFVEMLAEKKEWTYLQLYKRGIDQAVQIERVFRVLKMQNPDTYLKQLVALHENLPIKSRADIAADGHDLMKWSNRRGGPWLKKYMAQMEELIIQGSLSNTKEAIKEWLQSCNLK